MSKKYVLSVTRQSGLKTLLVCTDSQVHFIFVGDFQVWTLMDTRKTEKQICKPLFEFYIVTQIHGIHKSSNLYQFSVMMGETTMKLLSNHSNGSVATKTCNTFYI